MAGLAENDHRQIMRSLLEISEENVTPDPDKLLRENRLAHALLAAPFPILADLPPRVGGVSLLGLIVWIIERIQQFPPDDLHQETRSPSNG
jgi:hypothetical protein